MCRRCIVDYNIFLFVFHERVSENPIMLGKHVSIIFIINFVLRVCVCVRCCESNQVCKIFGGYEIRIFFIFYKDVIIIFFCLGMC